MISEIFSALNSALYENFGLAILASFGWGILSILLSPCHLSSIPLIVGYINSQGKISLARTFTVSLVFATGILITIGLIGIVTASLGRLMGDIGAIGNYLVAGIFFVIGLYLLGVISLPLEGGTLKQTKTKGLLSALVLGLLFGIALGPCTFAYMAPVLGVVFKTAQTNFIAASVLLLAFGLGHCVVIVGAGTLTQKVQLYLNWTESSNAIGWIKKVCGVLVIASGIFLLYNN